MPYLLVSGFGALLWAQLPTYFEAGTLPCLRWCLWWATAHELPHFTVLHKGIFVRPMHLHVRILANSRLIALSKPPFLSQCIDAVLPIGSGGIVQVCEQATLYALYHSALVAY